MAAEERRGAELRPTDQPRTKQEALAMALRWGAEWSHWNEHHGMCDNQNPAEMRGAYVTAAQHDAAEVQRLAALHSMLPDQKEES